MKNYAILFLLPLLALGITGCSNTSNIINSNEIIPKKEFQNSKNISFKVIDNRKVHPNIIDGADEAKLEFNLPVAKYFENYFNKSVNADSRGTPEKVISVFIDQFRLEHGDAIKYSFRFSSPYSGDTSMIIRLASKYTDAKSLSSDDKDLVSLTLTQSLDSFFVQAPFYSTMKDAAHDEERNIKQLTNDEEQKQIIINESPTRKNVIFNTALTVNPKQKTSDSSFINNSEIEDVKIPEGLPQKIRLSSFGMSAFNGNKVAGGIQLYYATGSIHPDAKFLFSYGLGFLFYNTATHFARGQVLTVGPSFLFQYFFSGFDRGLFIGTQARVSIGNEKINNHPQSNSKLFGGPTVEPHLGLKVANIFSVDAGFFLLKFFGSNVLPEDIGARVNLNIWF